MYFVLEKPVKELLPHIKRLEFDINGELDIPNVKVLCCSFLLDLAFLSMIPYD